MFEKREGVREGESERVEREMEKVADIKRTDKNAALGLWLQFERWILHPIQLRQQ